MTSQLARGARSAIQHVEAELNDIIDAVQLARDHRLDPLYVRDRLEEILDAVARGKRRLREDVEPLLVRRDPTTEQRLAEIEERLTSLETERRLRQ